MPLISLPAHFDGKRICLDEKFKLEPNTKLLVKSLVNLGTPYLIRDNE